MSAGETRLHGVLEEAGDGSQVGTERAEFLRAVEFVVPSQDAGAVNLVTRLLLQPRLAAVGHGLVERLEVFERGLVAFLRGRAEVFVEPPVGGAPGLGLLRAELPGEVFAQQRMGIEASERRRTASPVHREQLRGLQPGEGQFRCASLMPDERLRSGPGWRAPSSKAARQSAVGGPVEQAQQPQHGQGALAASSPPRSRATAHRHP